MIYCPKCGTANRQGSKFCNECGTSLPATGLRCPMCGAMNPTGNLYCDRCGARLIPAEQVSPEEEKAEHPSPPKGISLPSVPLGEEGWLSELRAEAEALDLLSEEETPERPEELEALPEAAVPDWLKELEAPAAPPAPEAQPPQAAVPDRLKEPEAPAAPPAPEAQPPQAAVPDWLKELEETVPEPPPPAERPTPPLAGIPAPPSEEIPEWLRDIEFAPPIEEPSAQPPSVAPVDVHAGTPSAPTTVLPILTEEGEPPVTTPGEIPDWLKEAPEEAPPAFGSLVPAEIPEWLRALQPREVAIEEEPVETEGFLSGLRGLLPVGKGLDMPVTAHPPLPRAPSPAAVARAELLQGLLSRPMITPPTAEIREAPRQSGWVLTRFLVGVILLAAIILPMLVRLPLFGPPIAPTAETAFDTVGQLQENTPVLIAWEYGPAESDEMDRVAGPLIEHLLRRKARLIVVSTRLEGPAAAEALLASSRLVDPSERSQRIANLGYVPGQAAGVREALGNLSGRTEAVTGLPASQLGIMTDVHSIADVGMVVILAAQPDDLKTWLEQISVANPPVPVVAGVSARTELISTPYLTAGQLKGMVAGLTGGAVYERQLDTGRGREYEYYLTSLGMAQLAIAALTVIGALIFLVGGGKR